MQVILRSAKSFSVASWLTTLPNSRTVFCGKEHASRLIAEKEPLSRCPPRFLFLLVLSPVFVVFFLVCFTPVFLPCLLKITGETSECNGT